ncbi:MAG: DUF992 domain-containing protein [Pseudomonadota bacterium]
MMRTSLKFAFVAAVLACAPTAIAQQTRVEAGVIDCRGTTAAFVVGSVTEMNCVFKSSDGTTEPYSATMRRAGLDLGINQQIAVAWAVFAPSRQIGRGELAGTYVGGAASATVGVGVGANALIGGSNNTIAFQPVSVQGQTGLSVAAGIAGLELRAQR